MESSKIKIYVQLLCKYKTIINLTSIKTDYMNMLLPWGSSTRIIHTFKKQQQSTNTINILVTTRKKQKKKQKQN